MADILSLDAHRPAPNEGNGAHALVHRYLTSIYPARRHGKTDCGEYLADGGALPDGDHFLIWLACEGFAIVPLESVT